MLNSMTTPLFGFSARPLGRFWASGRPQRHAARHILGSPHPVGVAGQHTIAPRPAYRTDKKWMQKHARDSDPPLARVMPPPPLSHGAVRLQERLQARLVDPLEAANCFEREGDLGMLHVCLEGFHQQIEQLPPKDRTTAIRKGALGKRALAFLWSEDSLWTSVTLDEHWNALLDRLVYLAVAENADDLIVDWVQMDLPKGVKITNQKDAIWRSVVLRRLVKAYNAHSSPRSADRAIETLFRLKDERSAAVAKIKGAKQGAWVSLLDLGLLPNRYAYSLNGPAIEIATFVTRAEVHSTNTSLYENFRQFWEKRNLGVRDMSRDLNIALLYANHPKRPSIGHFVTYLKRYFEEMGHDNCHVLDSNPGLARKIQTWINHGTKIAERNCEPHVAEWLRKKGSELFPVS